MADDAAEVLSYPAPLRENARNQMSFHGLGKEKQAMQDLAKVYNIHFH